jgi:hypothetical protein
VSNNAVIRSRILWRIIVLLGLLDVGLIVLWIVRLPQPNRNTLAIGEMARVASVNVDIQPPIELDWKSKSEVLRLRSAAVQQRPELLASEYTPDEHVFGQIVDELPWWGMQGQFFYGKGERSIAGPSEESRFILNPYLLVAADFYDDWQGRIAETELSTFPLTCLPRDLRWEPREARAEVTYDAECVDRGENYTFDLIAYNARDLNLNYIFVSYQDSTNITKPGIPTMPFANPQFIHHGGSCGYPGGCNNMSPYTPEIDGLEITALPAQVIIWLWKHKPTSREQTPDMVFILHFR